MASANSYNSPGNTGANKEFLMEDLSILEPEDTPFTSLVGKGTTSATFAETVADTLRKPRTSGSREGDPAKGTNNKAKNRKRFGVYVHRVFDEYAVTDVQQAVTLRGGNAVTGDELDYAKAKSLREVKRDMEAVNCGTQDHNGGDDDAMQTRGAGSWISSSAQATNPVPSDFRTPSGAILSGVTAITEAQLNGILQTLHTQYGGKRNYVGILGSEVVEAVDNFTRVQPSSTNQRYQVHETAGSKQITMQVQIFESSFGRLEVVPTQFNAVDANGDGDTYTGYIINPELWELLFLEELFAQDLEDEGGGQHGFIRGMWANICKNPKGNGKVYNS